MTIIEDRIRKQADSIVHELETLCFVSAYAVLKDGIYYNVYEVRLQQLIFTHNVWYPVWKVITPGTSKREEINGFLEVYDTRAEAMARAEDFNNYDGPTLEDKRKKIVDGIKLLSGLQRGPKQQLNESYRALDEIDRLIKKKKADEECRRVTLEELCYAAGKRNRG